MPNFYEKQAEKFFNKLMVNAKLKGALTYLTSEDGLKGIKSVEELAARIRAELETNDREVESIE